MSEDLERIKAASRRLYEEAFGRGNLAAVNEVQHPEMVSHGPGMPPLIGRDQIKRQAVALRGAFPDLKTTLLDQFAAGDRVCSRWAGSGTFTGQFQLPGVSVPPTGEPIYFEEIRIDRYLDGVMVEAWFIPDRLSLWQKMGLVAGAPPPRPS